MRRLNIYFIHSTKFDYNNLLYKKVLESSVCLSHNLWLPQTKEYQDKYTKDLMNKADIIIVELSHPSFGLTLELKFLKKINKPKLFISLDNKVPRKYKKLISNFKETNEGNYIKTIEEFIHTNESDIRENYDNTITLGQFK